MTWAEVAQVPLCLLTPDMQNRRIIDGLLRAAGGESEPTLESDSMILLFSHVRTGRWASVMPAKLAETLGPHRHDPRDPDRRARGRADHRPCRAAREPMTPLTAALVAEAQRLAPELEAGESRERTAGKRRS